MPWMLGNGMPDAKARSSNWKAWTAEQWGGALFEHFFAVTGGNRQPVSRLPGTTNMDHLRENMGAINVQLTPADLREIETGFSRIEIYGGRMDARQMAQIGKDGD